MLNQVDNDQFPSLVQYVEVNKHRLLEYSNDAFSCIDTMIDKAGHEAAKADILNPLLVEAVHSWCSIHSASLSNYSNIIPFLITVLIFFLSYLAIAQSSLFS